MCSQSFSVHTLLRMSGGPAAQPSPASAPGAGGSSRWALAVGHFSAPGGKSGPGSLPCSSNALSLFTAEKAAQHNNPHPHPRKAVAPGDPLPRMCGRGAVVRCGRRMQPDPQEWGNGWGSGALQVLRPRQQPRARARPWFAPPACCCERRVVFRSVITASIKRRKCSWSYKI